jgi:hypothetical protein
MSRRSRPAPQETAKNSEASIGTRLGAAKDAVGDKMDQEKHEGTRRSPVPLSMSDSSIRQERGLRESRPFSATAC